MGTTSRPRNSVCLPVPSEVRLSLIKYCPKCGQKNRLPDEGKASGRYRCGTCGATVARTTFGPRWLWLLTAPWLFVLAVIGLSNLIGPDRWIPGAINLFLPQWLYALPAIVLVPCFLVAAPRLVWVPLAALLFVATSLMGFTWTFPPTAPLSQRLKVMTFNMKWGFEGTDKVCREIAEFDPDVVQLQDVGKTLWSPDAPLAVALKGYHVRHHFDFVVASKYPLTPVQSIDTDFPGYEAHIDRTWMRYGKAGIAFYNVHFLTPRFGLIALKKHNLGKLVNDTNIRLESSQILAANVGQDHGPIIITGDFNAPVQSLVCRNVGNLGFTDAFQAAGRGYGYTYGQDTPVKRPYVRIDHIYVNKYFRVLSATTGGTDASEHVPVRAVVALAGM